MSMTRRQFLAATAGAAALPALAACQDSGTDRVSWSATQDDSLGVLTWEVSGGGVVAMPGEGWAKRDGYIQLQLAGGSIPGAKVERVTQSGSKLTVKLESSDGPASMDLLLTEWCLEPSTGGVEGIESVTVDHGGGDVRELEEALE